MYPAFALVANAETAYRRERAITHFRAESLRRRLRAERATQPPSAAKHRSTHRSRLALG